MASSIFLSIQSAFFFSLSNLHLKINSFDDLHNIEKLCCIGVFYYV